MLCLCSGNSSSKYFSVCLSIPFLIALAALCCVPLGCAKPPSTTGGGGTGGGSSPVNYVFMTGNWELKASPTSGSAPFTLLSGFINESGTDPGVSDFTTAALQTKSATCFMTSPDLPMQGGVHGSSLGLVSFPINGQVISISAEKDGTVTHISGNYTITGGCADGAQGTIAGTLFEPLDGSYSGAVTGSGRNVALDLVQSGQGTGEGLSFLYGSANFKGISCFSTASVVTSKSYVIGSSVIIDLITDETASSEIVMSGSADPTGATLTLDNVQVSGGSCAGAINSGALTLAK